jgi:HEPN domain-containing protein
MQCRGLRVQAGDIERERAERAEAKVQQTEAEVERLRQKLRELGLESDEREPRAPTAREGEQGGRRNLRTVREQTRWWWQTAESDWDAAQTLGSAANYANAAFHLQQAAEKALKALLCEHGERTVTHSCVELMVMLERLGEKFPEKLDTDLRRLDRSYIDSRYPNGVGGPPSNFYDEVLFQELVECCRRAMEFVRSRLS